MSKFDRLNRLIEKYYSVDGKRASWSYDANGNVVSSIAPSNLTTTYSYDRLDRLNGRMDPGGLFSQFLDDVVNDRGLVIDPDGGKITMIYDTAHRMLRAQAQDGLWTTFTYDLADRKTSVRQPLTYRRGYGYDAAGQILTLVTDNGGATVIDRFTYTYDPNGNRLTIQDLNGSRTTYTYDPKNRLTRDQTSGTNAHDYTYTYDPNGNRLTSAESGFEAFTYDAANRLVTSVSAAGTTSYVFDRNGTQIQVAEPDGTLYTCGTDGEFRETWQKKNGSNWSSWSYNPDGKLATCSVEGSASVTTMVWDGERKLQARQ